MNDKPKRETADGISPSLLQEKWGSGGGKVVARDTADLAEGIRVAQNATRFLLDFPPSLKTSRNRYRAAGMEKGR